MSRQRSALVVGLGVAGMASAIGLRRAGWQVTLIERAPQRRLGGYFIGLFGTGLSAAKRLGVMPDLHTRTPKNAKTWDVTRAGDRHRINGFLDQPGDPQGVLRGDIEAALFENLGDVEVRYGTVPTAIVDIGGGAVVTTQSSRTGKAQDERFDLVVGADGVRSTVRRLVFGPHERYLKPLHAMICAFQLDKQVPYFPINDGIVLAEPGRSLWVFPFEDRPPTALFSYRTRDIDAQFRASVGTVLRRAYGPEPFGEILDHVFEQFDGSRDFLFDSVNQVSMRSWRSGRTILLGDAAWCLTLYSGMGASLGLAGGSLLGELLSRHPHEIDAALGTWEERLMPFARQHQRSALIKAQFFTPSSPIIDILCKGLMRRAQGKKRSEGAPTALEQFLSGPVNVEFAA
ncbi:FAD-dependent monooxygenase [Polyangium sorediatum]|uniref:FAD-dependent monooxygenase n=1 Tax=Polyangium sorediatum TaxID=889274 RepID=A0ABT6NL94_9BACT|nr:FAD-dependent monooxygenase [Polyangium sorediatum]MDI1429086.1 FAD-dependent monooxygenase [Polyangium sorediatum]